MAKILLIDDSEEVRSMVTQILGKEHELHTVDNWAKALNIVFQMHLALIDVKMPGLKGDQIAKIFKDKVQNTKIVLFSAMDELQLRKMTKDIGAAGYIQKTFEEKLLKVRVKRFLRN